jgi:polyhydroxyalkanoate synthase
MTLKGYGDAKTGPIVLLVPAPIKRAYIWDLCPHASVVQQCLHGGCQVYLIQWERPGTREQSFGLDAYADRLIHACLDVIRAETGETRTFLAGHSLGGTLAAICAALHPERVQGLVLLGAPLNFGPDVGTFGPLIAASPPTQTITALLGNMPGSFLNVVSLLAAPGSFGWLRWLDALRSLADLAALQTYLLVERWTLDESPLARRLFEEITELLYRENRFMRGTLAIDGRLARPDRLVAPLLSVVDRSCPIAPPSAVLPFHQAVQSTEQRVLWYAGDTGVALQHVGMLVGRHAHQQIWPEILRWIHAQRHSEMAPRFA